MLLCLPAAETNQRQLTGTVPLHQVAVTGDPNQNTHWISFRAPIYGNNFKGGYRWVTRVTIRPVVGQVEH